MLIKFLRTEHLEDFKKGELYFKNAGYFIDLESQAGDKGIGDKYEGSFFRAFNPATSKIEIETEQGIKIPIKFNRGFVSERYEAARQFQMTCFTGITEEDVEEISENTSSIKNNLISSLNKEFPDRIPVLITNETEFLNRVSKAFKEMGISVASSFVRYFDEYTLSPLEEAEYQKDITLAFFYKRNYFQAQKEYRIITREPIDKDSVTISLGDISELVYAFKNTDDLKNLRIVRKTT